MYQFISASARFMQLDRLCVGLRTRQLFVSEADFPVGAGVGRGCPPVESLAAPLPPLVLSSRAQRKPRATVAAAEPAVEESPENGETVPGCRNRVARSWRNRPAKR